MSVPVLLLAGSCLAAGVSESVDGGERTIVLSNRFGRVELTLRGAQIRSWQDASGNEALFRPSDMAFRGTADNRGGIPVCWPWFGANGEKDSLPHGFARYSTFELRGSLEEADGTSVTLGLAPSAATRAIWPYDCDLAYTVTLGRALRLTLKTTNLGARDVWITEGLHPYWRVSDRRKVAVVGLDGAPYCFAEETRKPTAKWKGDFIPAGHFDHVFWRGDTVIVADPGLGREIRISGRNYNKYVIWTPPEFAFGEFENLRPENTLDFACVEPATLFREDGYALKPGESHVMEVSVSCGPGSESHLFGRIADADRFVGRHPRFRKAFEFLMRRDLSELKAGRYEIDGTNCWAMIQECTLTSFSEENTFEAHRAFIDIQAPISGPETMGIVRTPEDSKERFDKKGDYVLFKAKGEARTLEPGEFAVFFPSDGAHASNLSLSGDRPHRKLVIKVRW